MHGHHEHSPHRVRPASGYVLVGLLSAVLLLPVSLGWAQERTGQDQIDTTTPSGFGIGAASVLLSIPYGAVKVTYAVLGGIIGGFTYAFSAGDTEAAQAVWTPSLRGTYVLTPEHLKGDRRIQFMGQGDKHEDGSQARLGQPLHIVVTDTR